jgi:PAS domain S-box-containing protein
VSGNQTDTDHLSRRLLDLVSAMSLAVDLEVTLAALMAAALELVHSDGVAVMWLDGEQLRVQASSGSTAALPGLILPASQVGAARPVLDSNRHVLVADTADDVRWQRVPGEEQARSWLGVPLLLEGRALGLLEWTARRAMRFDEQDVDAAREIAGAVAPILHRAQLIEDMRRRLRELAELQPGTPGEALDPVAELLSLTNEACEYTGARHAFIFLLEGEADRMHCAAATGDLREVLGRTSLSGDGTLGGWSTPHTRPPGRRRGGPSDREVMAALGIKSIFILPLRAKGQAIGILGVAERADGAAFGPDAARIMTHLASQASLILEQSYRAKPEPSRHDYEQVIQSSPLAVGVLAHSGDIRFCNPGMAELLSRSSQSLVGRNLSEFVVTGDRKRFGPLLEEVVISGQRRQLDVRLRALGEQRHARISLAPLRASDEQGDNAVAILEDITPLKILEQERVEHLRELREKHNQLKELDQLRSRFVSNVSHELRTPLAVIKLYATLARKGRPEKQAHYLQTIEQETHRLETMVENILDLTRIDRQALQMHPELLEPAELIAQVLEVYGETARQKGIGLSNAVRGPLPQLWADKNHLVQMLTNLVDNALKYTPPGGQVWAAAREIQPDSGPVLEISVGDTGAGIPEEEQGQVFERFFRGSNNTPATSGTGLGLAIVQELMVQHGGEVKLLSRVGEGSVFALQFPLRHPHGDDALPSVADAGSGP